MKVKVVTRILALVFGISTIGVSAKELVKASDNKTVKKEIAPNSNYTKLISFNKGKSGVQFSLTNNTEGFYARSSELFSSSPLDQIVYVRNTWDAALEANVNQWVKTKLVLRNKATWGNEGIVATTSDTFKLGDAVAGSHRHYIGKLVPWIKEGWFDFSLNKAAGLDDMVQHRVKVGSFGFKLGRGISLGSAYNVSNGILGFYSSGVVDQYAFGSQIYGDIRKDKLSYNLYSAILENYSDKFSRVNAAAFASEIGRKENPQRGYGNINFIVAANLKWQALDGTGGLGKMTVEPYITFNRAPEQKIEFTSDASSRLATFGLSTEYVGDVIEWGCELAGNFGSQKVRDWDRNKVVVDRDSDGVIKNFYTHVRINSASGSKALVGSHSTTTSGSTVADGTRAAVNASLQGADYNGKEINTSGHTLLSGVASLWNDSNRFRTGYTNRYKGMMFVADGVWNLQDDKKLKLVGTVGWASGDESPNVDLGDAKAAVVDGDYQGFVGLQEVYSGKRVPSIFVIGSNDVVRPLSSPNNGFAINTSGFTNLAYIGGGVDWQVKALSKGWRIKSNVLSYWQDKATKKYDITTALSLDDYANKHLGVEINSSVRCALMGGLAAYVTGGIFKPGKHYDDIKGQPLNSSQLKALDSLDSTGYPDNGVPVIGTSTAIVLDWGLELSF